MTKKFSSLKFVIENTFCCSEIENNIVKNELVRENLDKGKSILGAPLKQDKEDVKNPKAKKVNS